MPPGTKYRYVPPTSSGKGVHQWEMIGIKNLLPHSGTYIAAATFLGNQMETKNKLKAVTIAVKATA